MRPEQEIQRIENDYRDHWPRLKTHPDIIAALKNNDPIKLGEVAAQLIYGEWDAGNGAKTQNYRHQVLVCMTDGPIWFVTLEAAKLFITNKRVSDKSVKIRFVMQKLTDGGWGDVLY